MASWETRRGQREERLRLKEDYLRKRDEYRQAKRAIGRTNAPFVVAGVFVALAI